MEQMIYSKVASLFLTKMLRYFMRKYFSRSIGPFLEKAVAHHSSTLAWKIPWMEEPGGLQSMGSLRVRDD